MIRREFFEERENKMDEYREKRYLPLDEAFQQSNISAQQLLDAGLLQMKTIQSTADLLDYHVIEKGKSCLKELQAML
ncbi:hypothetical protein MNBD_GAMMA06-2129 [hydrothermal vent metagenome]|uniref:Uncharacterized protein n=1 Tax=hydrothermal vent metagenome TaxID=652676 RepID=A0A3B0WKF8_9ZZZZ